MQSKFNCCSFIPFLLLISFAYKLLLACYIYISPPTLFVSQGQLLQNDNMKSDDEQIRLFSLIHELPYPCVLYIIIPDHVSNNIIYFSYLFSMFLLLLLKQLKC